MKKYLPYVLALCGVMLLTGVAAHHLLGQGYLAYPGFVLWAAAFVALDRYAGADWASALYFTAFAALTVICGAFLAFYTRVPQYWFVGLLGGSAVVAVPLFMEFVVLRVAESHPLGAVARVTYYEALLQPFTLIVVGFFMAVIFLYTFVPFYTFEEDHKMFRDTATSFVLLAALIVMVYAAAKVVDEEIENRTMLTLMSKPIARWQVIVGKYLGIAALIFVIVVLLGCFTGVCSFLRFFDDKRVDFYVARGDEAARLFMENDKATLAFLPMFVLEFLQVATLAAVAVAISTRWPLALNVVIIAVLYVGANLTRFIADANLSHADVAWLFDVCVGAPGLIVLWCWLKGRGPRTLAFAGVAMLAAMVHVASHYGGWAFNAKPAAVMAAEVLPSLSNFDLSPRLVYGTFRFGGEAGTDPTYGYIWQYVGVVAMYGVLYIAAGLALATAMFRTRELT